MMRKIVLAVTMTVAAAAVAEAGPIYTCPGGSSECAGQTFALWIAGSGTDGGGQYFDVSLSINTTGYTGSESDLAHGVEFKNVIDSNAVYANLVLISAPGGVGAWTVFTGNLNPGQECEFGNAKKDTACTVQLTAPGGYDFFIGEILTWTFRFNAVSLGDSTGHLKYYYTSGYVPCVPKTTGSSNSNSKNLKTTSSGNGSSQASTNGEVKCEPGTGEWTKVAGLLSQDIPLQDCLDGSCDSVPEPATVALIGTGLAFLAVRRRRKA